MQNGDEESTFERIYLDHNATTPHSKQLKLRWNELIDLSGNPSSIHQEGRNPKTILRETRNKLALMLNCSPLEIVFNSGGSEGNSSILKSVFYANANKKNEFIISQVEHPSVIKAANQLEQLGARVHYIPVNRKGEIDLKFIKDRLSDKTALVSVMYANNETGSIFPVEEIATLVHQKGALMHSDCVQAIGKTEFDFKKLNLDYASFSAHKFYSIKGTGFCYIKKNSPWMPLINGGGQERGRRGGTENIIGIGALNIVLDEIVNKSKMKIVEMRNLRDLFEELILEKLTGVTITARESKRLANTSSLVIDNVDGETLLMSLDLKSFAVSTGAACSSGNPEPSPVLLAMGLSRDEAQSSLRVSIGWETTEKQIRDFVNCLILIVERLRKINLEDQEEHYVG